MKVTLHTAAVDGGPFNCRPAMVHELDPDKVLTNDVVLPWESHPHGTRLYVIGHEFGALAALWAESEQDAMDILCDQGLSDPFLVEDHEMSIPHDDGTLTALGNAGDLHNLNHAWCLPVAWDMARDVQALAKFAEARGASHDNLGDL
jgi:hypothetical protein